MRLLRQNQVARLPQDLPGLDARRDQLRGNRLRLGLRAVIGRRLALRRPSGSGLGFRRQAGLLRSSRLRVSARGSV